MDIYEYLKADHKKVAHLFEQFEKEKSAEIKVEIVTLIVKELLVHENAKQATFYEILKQYPEAREAAEQAEEMQAEIEACIDVVTAGCENPNKAWENKVDELKKMVEHHVNEEEGTVFSKAKKVINEDETMALKEKMHTYKTKILQTADLESV